MSHTVQCGTITRSLLLLNYIQFPSAWPSSSGLMIQGESFHKLNQSGEASGEIVTMDMQFELLSVFMWTFNSPLFLLSSPLSLHIHGKVTFLPGSCVTSIQIASRNWGGQVCYQKSLTDMSWLTIPGSINLAHVVSEAFRKSRGSLRLFELLLGHIVSPERQHLPFSLSPP